MYRYTKYRYTGTKHTGRHKRRCEQLGALRAETAELRRFGASLRQDHTELAGKLESEAQERDAQGRKLEARLENETQERNAQGSKLERSLATEVKNLGARLDSSSKASERALQSCRAKLEDAISQLDNRMQKMVNDLRADGNAALEVRRQMNNELNFTPNFEGLVLGCIDADFCK